ncbi:acyl-CoA/acyl-ACP dehydrogenase [Rhizobium changzhiense]|uniref:acyl-CoA dehydrogenase family protein n=1 Tax=Rhizobium changzhiense TaxID=2692317 RepID=UPI001F0C6061|nr:acyl-CoA dehydrogenase family protein [Rhizobium changzhiense]MCH4547468.1 acyl-CoA/acyl-ACP dehydrogenase [Rhizobium changzhiense]
MEDQLAARTRRAAKKAAEFADSVDREARFPLEGATCLKSEQLLSLLIPKAAGGEGRTVGDVAQVCAELGRACSSTAMIFAMHQVAIACILEAEPTDFTVGFLRQVCREQLLVASSTTEASKGGKINVSSCAVSRKGDNANLSKEASVISYGEDADAILCTARRALDAAASDQVLVLLLKHQIELRETTQWDTLGMRGTQSKGFSLRSNFHAEQVLQEKIAVPFVETMQRLSHIFWGAVWYGLATEALFRACALVKGQAATPPVTLARAACSSQTIWSSVTSLIGVHSERESQAGFADKTRQSLFANQVKVSSAELLVEVLSSCMMAAGLRAYRNDTPFSLSRLLRDAFSAPLMISNERILADSGLMMSMLDDFGQSFTCAPGEPHDTQSNRMDLGSS